LNRLPSIHSLKKKNVKLDPSQVVVEKQILKTPPNCIFVTRNCQLQGCDLQVAEKKHVLEESFE